MEPYFVPAVRLPAVPLEEEVAVDSLGLGCSQMGHTGMPARIGDSWRRDRSLRLETHATLERLSRGSGAEGKPLGD